MTKLKKYLIWTAVVMVTIIGLALAYLFIDRPYPSFSTSGLIKTESSQIPTGKSVIFPTDSLIKNISSKNEWFVDRSARVMVLHGINVGGSSKIPFTPRMGTHQKENFYESVYTVSFVGRPFPLAEADQHFERLYQWGYRFVRLLVTWEAIEHAGPGKYDEDYLNYIQAIVKKAGEHNINVFIDPHQDVWSRFTGGDGAPYWTLEKVGFDPLKFTETGAAIIHNIKGDPFPKMIWPTNFYKLAAASMFTLFLGGNDFAPHLKIDGLPAQDYLQSHYINAIKQVALKLKGLPNVIGFDTLNEPVAGYIGNTDLVAYGLLQNGMMPTAFEGMVLGGGNAVEIQRFEFALTGSKAQGRSLVNPNKFSAWKSPGQDIWKMAGVWGYDAQQKPVLLKPAHFSEVNGRKVDLSADYFKPFALKFKEAIHSVDSSWLIFAEAPLRHELPKFSSHESDKMVNAGHWYDVGTLLTKEYSSWFGVDVMKAKGAFGKRGVRKTFHDNIAHKIKETEFAFGEKPSLIGEFGIPFDLHEKEAYKTGDYSTHEIVLDRSFQAMESNLMSYTLWNYTSDNDNKRGDQWNGEDLSIFSISQQKDKSDINSGGRALAAAIRPYPYKIAGKPIEYSFNMGDREFYLKFNSDKTINAPTEIFVPDFHFGKGFEVWSPKGQLAYDKQNEVLLFVADTEGEQVIIVRAKR